MEPPFAAHIACSSIFLSCFVAELVLSASRLEHATRRESTEIDMLRPPAYTRRAEQVLPVVTAIVGVVYCACNLGLRSERSPDPVDPTK